MLEKFIERNFSAKSQTLIEDANKIADEYVEEGFTLTLRQLYYQLVARDIIENTVNSYKRLGSLINDARLAGLVDWAVVEDRTRNLKGIRHYDGPEDAIESAVKSFALDKWEGQKIRPELWIEKEALAGVIERAAIDNDLYYLSCRGYMSASEMYEAAQRIFRRRKFQHQKTVIIYLGDHDPSGLDMSDNDIPGRFKLFFDKWNRMTIGAPKALEIRRVALNFDQIELYNPPPNPAKETDSRFAAYQEQFGDESWELDALPPTTLLEIIQAAVDEFKDVDMYQAKEAEEAADRSTLKSISANYDEVEQFLSDKKDDEDEDEY